MTATARIVLVEDDPGGLGLAIRVPGGHRL